MWFPKEQSNEIVNLIAEINRLLGGTYFTVAFHDGGFYTLNPTLRNVRSRKFNHIAFEGNKTYTDMHNYLSGIIHGVRAAKQLNNKSNL